MIRIAGTLAEASTTEYWSTQIKDRFGIVVKTDKNCGDSHILYRQLFHILLPIPPALVKDCGVLYILFRSDMGLNRPEYPNHGYYNCNKSLVALNADCFWHPDKPEDFFDHRGYFLTRAQQTVAHELGHGADYNLGNLSMQPSWMSLSGWSETPKLGLVRLKIQDIGTPMVLGEMFYDPKAEFTRFYGKRNSYDDWADCFSFYVMGTKNKVPSEKRAYFDRLLSKYY